MFLLSREALRLALSQHTALQLGGGVSGKHAECITVQMFSGNGKTHQDQ